MDSIDASTCFRKGDQIKKIKGNLTYSSAYRPSQHPVRVFCEAES